MDKFMITYSKEEIDVILVDHQKWLNDRQSGKCANLALANLSGINLNNANLRKANLQGADLRLADLQGADLDHANLKAADLSGANLIEADLFAADLRAANLCRANLCRANLCRAKLRCSNLNSSNLIEASLFCADLRSASINGAALPDNTFMIFGHEYFISIENGKSLRAGCQSHHVEDWRSMTEEDIANMDGQKALRFYPKLLDILDLYTGKGDRPEWLTDVIAS